MESVLGRYRNLIILVGVLFLQVLGLAVQVKRGSNDAQDTRLIRIWAVDAITPFERVLIWLQNGTSNVWHNYFYLRGVRIENRQLKEQIEQMRLAQVRLSEDAAQARRLQALLGFKEQFISRTVAAQVIGSSGSDLSRVVYIDKGSDAGIKPDLAVITADGVVGKVLDTYPSVAKVLLINDQSSGVGVILGDSRLQGVLVGTVNGEVALNGVMSDEQVPAGEAVLTSGGDQIFPKGLPVGTVAKVGSGKDLFLSIKVKPAANLSKLEEVLVLVEKKERQATAEDTTKVRAADILAQRLPSVPDKPAGSANAAAGTATVSTNPASTTNAGSRPNSTAQETAKNSAGTGHVQGAPAAGQPGTGQPVKAGEHASPAPSAPKTTNNPGSIPKAPAAQPKPVSAPPKPVPPPANSQPPADQNSPD